MFWLAGSGGDGLGFVGVERLELRKNGTKRDKT